MQKSRLDEISGWFAGRLPDGWFTGAPSVTIDGDQVVVVGTLAAPEIPAGASAEYRAGFEAARIHGFRERTRGQRIHIAREVERRYEIPVTWGAACGSTAQTFNPGGSGRRQEGGGEDPAQAVMIAARPGPGPRGRGPWGPRFQRRAPGFQEF